MIKFEFKGNPSEEEKLKAQHWFLNELGPFKEEFENNNGVVTFDYNIPKTSHDHCQYSYDLDLYNFILRWEQYRKSRGRQ